MPNKQIELERFSYADDGTFGVLHIDGHEFFTVERPWLANKRRVSCIPEGLYTLEMRTSPVVKRSSGGEFTDGWEVTNVPDRTYIMIHPGNTMDDLAGCIAPGMAMGRIKGKQAVTSSRAAFRKVMKLLETEGAWDLLIHQKRAS